MTLQSSYGIYQQVSQFMERNLKRTFFRSVDTFRLGEQYSPLSVHVYDMVRGRNEFDARFDYHARKSDEAMTLARDLAEIIEQDHISFYGPRPLGGEERKAASEVGSGIMHAATTGELTVINASGLRRPEEFVSIDTALDTFYGAEPSRTTSLHFYGGEKSPYGRSLGLTYVRYDTWNSLEHLHFDFRTVGPKDEILPRIERFEDSLARYERTQAGASSKREYAADQFRAIVEGGNFFYFIMGYINSGTETSIGNLDIRNMTREQMESTIYNFLQNSMFPTPEEYIALLAQDKSLRSKVALTVNGFLDQVPNLLEGSMDYKALRTIIGDKKFREMLDFSKEDLKNLSPEELENLRDTLGEDIINGMLEDDSEQ